MDRDAQIAELIRREIEKQMADLQRAGWRAPQTEWYIARGEITGLRAALKFVDPNPWR